MKSLCELYLSQLNFDSPKLIHVGGDHTLLNFEELILRSINLSQILKNSYHVSKGDRVVINYGNTIEFLMSVVATHLLGAIVVPLNPKESSWFWDYVLGDTQASLVLGNYNGSLKKEIFKFSYDEIQTQSSFGPVTINSNDLAAIFYTSGTTGHPKGVALTHSQIISNLKATQEHLSLDRNRTHLCVMPLFHVNAFNFSFLGSLLAGNDLIVCEEFNPIKYLKLVEEYPVKVLSLSPSIVKMLLLMPKKDLSSVDYAISASAALAPEIANAFYEKFKVPILQGYGLSEAVNFTFLNRPLDGARYTTFFPGELPLGVLLPGQKAMIWDALKGAPCSEGEHGEILIKGENLMRGYWNCEDETLAAFQNGWLKSGDFGHFRTRNGDVYYFISGRLKEIIKRAGETIGPLEIENEIGVLAGGSSFCVLGFINKWTGEEVGLVIEESTSKIDLIEVKKTLERIPYFKRPKEIVLIDQLPKTGSGKIKRKELQHLFKSFEDKVFHENRKNSRTDLP